MNFVKRVACGISGGVDSAVAALLLKKKGFEVVGVYMKNWDSHDEAGTCLSSHDLEDAKSVCESLRIELVQVSFVKEYWNDVFSSLLEDYENGMTPNPDIFCNRFIKFGAFYKYAMEQLGVQAISTGHYARTTFGAFLENYQEGKNVNLLKAVDPIKDQTLFLSQVHQMPLRRTMFPLGSMQKTYVRQIAAKELGWISNKPDSTGICFIGDRKFGDFIAQYIPNKRGPLVDMDTNRIIGWHRGVHHYTFGQRCGDHNEAVRVYVAHRDPITQIIQTVAGKDNPVLYGNYVKLMTPHWIADTPPLSESKPFYCMFRFQHADRSVPCQLFLDEGSGLRAVLGIPLRALTPGQIAVFYKGPICLGSAKILSANNLRDKNGIESESMQSSASQV